MIRMLSFPLLTQAMVLRLVVSVAELCMILSFEPRFPLNILKHVVWVPRLIIVTVDHAET